ncbi:MAG: hypothetical protein Q9178_000363 [Gyalolechia marmorata]
MSTARTDDVTDPDSRVARRTSEYSYRKAKKRAGRGERERKSREAKWRARQAVQPEAGENTGAKRALKQQKRVKNKETASWKMMQARRWLENERRKLDKGGLTPEDVDDFVKWTRQGREQEATPKEQFEIGSIGIKRFLDEMKAAQQARGNHSGLRDWWVIEPPRPRALRKRWAEKECKKKIMMDEPIAKVAKSVVEPSGGALMALDVDQAENGLEARDTHHGLWTLEAVSFQALGKCGEYGKEGKEHANNGTAHMSKQLPVRSKKTKAGEPDGRNLHDMPPEPVFPHALGEVEDPDSDVDDMAPEPVLDADFTEDEETL